MFHLRNAPDDGNEPDKGKKVTIAAGTIKGPVIVVEKTESGDD